MTAILTTRERFNESTPLKQRRSIWMPTDRNTFGSLAWDIVARRNWLVDGPQLRPACVRYEAGFSTGAEFGGSTGVKTTIDDTVIGSAVTFSCWIRPNSLPPFQGVIDSFAGGAANTFFFLWLQDDKVAIQTGSSGNRRLSSTTLEIGKEYHVAGTLGTESVVYVNGKRENFGPGWGGQATAQPVWIGDGTRGGAGQFDGVIADAVVFPEQISDTEMEEIYTQTRVGLPTVKNRVLYETVAGPPPTASIPVLDHHARMTWLAR